MIQIVSSHQNLLTESGQLQGTVLIGFFGDFSQVANDTLPAFKSFCEKHPKWPAFLVDVGKTRDIHGRFQVTEVPTVILVQNGAIISQVTGTATCLTYEKAFTGSASHRHPTGTPSPSAKSVTVFSTRSCPWCVRVKNYLRSHHIQFKEVDLELDPGAARDLVRRTGQTGVPQLNINGSYVVGFDKTKIDHLLGLDGRERAVN